MPTGWRVIKLCAGLSVVEPLTNCAASAGRMRHLEMERLTNGENLVALADFSGHWINRVHGRQSSRSIVLEIDSGVSPTCGDQEGTRPLRLHSLSSVVRVQPVRRFRTLRASFCHLHSAHGWQDMLEPVVVRYRGKFKRRYFRADAAYKPHADAAEVAAPKEMFQKILRPIDGLRPRRAPA
jgi:hypothetical protein